jgi:hypothetical protein
MWCLSLSESLLVSEYSDSYGQNQHKHYSEMWMTLKVDLLWLKQQA